VSNDDERHVGATICIAVIDDIPEQALDDILADATMLTRDDAGPREFLRDGILKPEVGRVGASPRTRPVAILPVDGQNTDKNVSDRRFAVSCGIENTNSISSPAACPSLGL